MSILADLMEKVCVNCRVKKPYSQFNRCSALPDGRTRDCKACVKLKNNETRRISREWEAKGKEIARQRKESKP